jgi:hypothetical protein
MNTAHELLLSMEKYAAIHQHAIKRRTIVTGKVKMIVNTVHTFSENKKLERRYQIKCRVEKHANIGIFMVILMTIITDCVRDHLHKSYICFVSFHKRIAHKLADTLVKSIPRSFLLSCS